MKKKKNVCVRACVRVPSVCVLAGDGCSQTGGSVDAAVFTCLFVSKFWTEVMKEGSLHGGGAAVHPERVEKEEEGVVRCVRRVGRWRGGLLRKTEGRPIRHLHL